MREFWRKVKLDWATAYAVVAFMHLLLGVAALFVFSPFDIGVTLFAANVSAWAGWMTARSCVLNERVRCLDFEDLCEKLGLNEGKQ
jgi:hypothetical protein